MSSRSHNPDTWRGRPRDRYFRWMQWTASRIGWTGLKALFHCLLASSLIRGCFIVLEDVRLTGYDGCCSRSLDDAMCVPTHQAPRPSEAGPAVRDLGRASRRVATPRTGKRGDFRGGRLPLSRILIVLMTAKPSLRPSGTCVIRRASVNNAKNQQRKSL